VRRTLANSLLSLLLLSTLAGGGCLSCEQYFMWPAAKTCCSPDGHCKTKTPAQPKQNSGRECKRIAFDHQKSTDLHIDLPVAGFVAFDFSLRTVERLTGPGDSLTVEPSPPDLQVLHSTFLI
jgi:hypothetical protein